MSSWLRVLAKQLQGGKATPRRQARRRPRLEALEDRLAPAAVPVVSVAISPDPFIGTTHLPAAITFSNSSAAGATTPGYAPWNYVILPNVGVDGDPNEGVSFDSSVTPNYLGAPVAFQVSTVPLSGAVTGPAFALDTNGSPITLTGLRPDDQVAFFQLPFGSYVVDQPGGVINFAVNVSNEAHLGGALTLTAGGGFSFGNDPLNNPATDAPILAGTSTAVVTPTLFTVRKTYLGPEQETATGPNFKQQYAIDVSVANGQTVSGFSVTDVLPNNMQFFSLDTVTVNGGISTGNNAAGLTAGPGGTFTVNFNQVVGTAGPSDVRVVFTFYIPELDANGDEVLPLADGSFAPATNTVSASGTWTNPFDPTDGFNVFVTQDAAPDTITAKSVAVQKGVSVVGGGPVRQGSVLEYTIHFQVSDYFAFDQLNIGDLLPDGVRFDTTFIPTLAVSQHADGTANTDSSATAPFAAANYLAPSPLTFNADGTQTLNFAVSNELITRGQSGALIGGNIPIGGTGGANPPDAFNAPLFGGTTGTIVFRAVVQQEYDVRTSPNNNRDVKQGDSLTNVVPSTNGPTLSVRPGGRLLAFADLSPTATVRADNTAATVSILTGQIAKSIYAINGSTAVASPYSMQAGDRITFRLQYLLPNSTAENFRFTDFLPLPVFDATTLLTFDGTNPTNTVAPAAGVAVFGPGVGGPQPAGFSVPGGAVDYTTVFPGAANFPTITTDAATNTLQLTFPANLEDPLQRTSLVDVLFTVVVQDRPFGDGLYLTNQANAQEGNTVADLTVANAIQQVLITQPNLQLTKGVVSTNNPARTFSPGTVGPVTFAAPGGSGAAFTGTVTSTNLAASPVNSNVSNLHAGDLVKFAIVVQNTGSGVNGAFDVRILDTLPAGFVIPTNATGLNLRVTTGTGAALGYAAINGSDTNPLFQNGIQLTDPGATQGALAPGRDANGNTLNTGLNIAIITYDLQVQPDNNQADAVHPTQQLTNTATVPSYAAMPAGVDYLTTPLTDPATVTIAAPSLVKSLVATSEPTTTGSSVVIGEVVRYRLVVQMPPGVSPDLQVRDQLPAGLRYLGNPTVAFVSQNGQPQFASDTLTAPAFYVTGTSSNVSPTAALPPIYVSGGIGNGDAVTFLLGNVFNNDTADNTNATPEFVVIEFNALVSNIASNSAGTTRNNRFITQMAVGAGGTQAQVGPQSNSVGVTIVEPRVTTAKSVSPGTADVNDTVTYTITLTSNGGTTAFIPALTDVLPAAINVTSISASATGGVVNLVNHNTTGNTVSVTADFMPVGGVITVTVTGVVVSATVGVPIVNTANTTWSSLPGGVGTPVGASNTTGQTTPGTDGSATGARNGNTSAGGGSANTYATSANASLNIITPVPLKQLVATSEASTIGNNVAIGEVVRYRLAVRMPQAVSSAFQMVDTLAAGLRYLGDARVAFVSSNGLNLSSSDPAINNLVGLGVAGTSPNVTPTASLPAAAISVSGGVVTFSLGDVTNSDTIPPGAEFVVIEFNALVENVPGNLTGTTLGNTFIQRVNNGSGPVQVGPASAAVNVVVVQPAITNTTKEVTSVLRDPTAPVTYRVTYSNTGNADAFDVRLVDAMPAGLTLTPGSVVVRRNGGVIAAGVTNASTAAALDVTLARVAVGDTITISYTATISASVAAGAVITNTAHLTYTSLPGAAGTVMNPTGQTAPGGSGAADGERSGSGVGVNTYLGSDLESITVNSSTLMGVVYHDLNNNGIFDTGEPVIPGVTITLTGRDFLGNTVNRTATTDVNGQYTFTGLLPSQATNPYTLTETQPADFLNGKMTTPLRNFTGTIGRGSSVGRIVQFSDQYSRIVIGRESNLIGSSYNFGELTLSNTAPATWSIRSGSVMLFCRSTPTELSVNNPDRFARVEVTLSVTPGTGILRLATIGGLTFTAGANNSASMTFRGTVNAVNLALGLARFVPTTYYSGTTTLTFTSQSLDAGGNPVAGVSATNVVAITVAPVNHPPTIQAPTTQTTGRNVPLVFSAAGGNGIVVGDPDMSPSAGLLQLTLRATRGTLTLGTVAGLASVQGNGTGWLVVRGTLDALNAALDGLQFTPALNAVGAAALVLTLDDLGGPVGPAMRTGRTIAVTMT